MKQMRKKDWSHELTLAFAAPAPKRKEAFLKTMPVPQLDPRGFFFTQLQYVRKRTWIFSIFILLACIGIVRFASDGVLENRCIAAVSDFDHNYRICQIHAMEYGRTGNEL